MIARCAAFTVPDQFQSYLDEIKALLKFGEYHESEGIYSWLAAYEDGLTPAEAVADFRSWIES